MTVMSSARTDFQSHASKSRSGNLMAHGGTWTGTTRRLGRCHPQGLWGRPPGSRRAASARLDRRPQALLAGLPGGSSVAAGVACSHPGL